MENHTIPPSMMSFEIAALFEALAKAQGELTNPPRNASVKVKTQGGGSYGFQYATLDAILDLARPILARHGLSILQRLDMDGEKIRLETILAHQTGQWIKATAPINPTQAGPQGLGSAITYLRRYSLTALLGLAADEDDDGSAAHGHQSTPAPRPGNPAPKPATPPPAPKTQSPTPPAQAPKGDIATDPQQKALFGLGKALGLAGKEDLLRAVNGWLAREIPGRTAITSTSELTKAEASKIIESMKARAPAQTDQAGPDQGPAPDPAPEMDPMPW